MLEQFQGGSGTFSGVRHCAHAWTEWDIPFSLHLLGTPLCAVPVAAVLLLDVEVLHEAQDELCLSAGCQHSAMAERCTSIIPAARR